MRQEFPFIGSFQGKGGGCVSRFLRALISELSENYWDSEICWEWKTIRIWKTIETLKAIWT